jgi:hypothetical protein
VVTTRTVGPLHLEDLEPHRFEDLARQLIYDFRPWRQIEATGRSGADEGFDVRAFEIVSPRSLAEPPEEEQGEREDQDVARGGPDRQWLIQCKREKGIAPKKLVRYLNEIPQQSREGTYGIILMAACDFSLRARDAFRERVRELGFSEAHLWGRSEVEDMLFQPKNDHLLFAYFGISLQTKRRALKTDIRGRLAIKRKATNVLEHAGYVLIRDASDDRYPHLDPDEGLERFARGRWRVMSVEGLYHDGIRIKYRRHFAFLSEDGEHWDIAETHNDARPHEMDDPWSHSHPRQGDRQEVFAIWDALPQHERGWFEEHLVLPYDNVLAIDEDGDDVFEGPHVYTVPQPTAQSLMAAHCYEWLTALDGRLIIGADERRVRVFPRPKPA